MSNTQFILETLNGCAKPLVGPIKAYGQSIDLHYVIDPYLTEKGKMHFTVRLLTYDYDYPEPWAIMSFINELYEDELDDLEFFVKDWSENESWIDQMLKFPEFEDTGKIIDGHKVWKLIPTYLDQCTEPFHNHHDGCPVCDMPHQ